MQVMKLVAHVRLVWIVKKFAMGIDWNWDSYTTKIGNLFLNCWVLFYFFLFNRYLDCPFGTDEIGCFGCKKDEYSCFSNNNEFQMSNFPSGSMCYTLVQKCDGFTQCVNGRDEEECSMLIKSVNLHTVRCGILTLFYWHKYNLNQFCLIVWRRHLWYRIPRALYTAISGADGKKLWNHWVWFCHSVYQINEIVIYEIILQFIFRYPVCDNPMDWVKEACEAEMDDISEYWTFIIV